MKLLVHLILLSLILPQLGAGGRLNHSEIESDVATSQEAHRSILHLLNRTTFGPTASLVEQVSEMGIEAYLEQQLEYEAIADKLVEEKLQPLDTLSLDSKALIRAYYDRIKSFLNSSQMTENMTEEARIRYGLDQLMVEPNPANSASFTLADQVEFLLDRIDIRAIGELQNAKIIRAVHSERQLYEVMVDFWSNHFNIDVRKAAAGPLKIVDDREVIRAHALGNFKDLLNASAHSPAMLVYLDNNENSVRRKLGWFEKRIRNFATGYLLGVDADSVNANGDPDGMIGGLNENYGRELLELHTLGVDGGYTQKDVVEVSRVFTGWGYSPLNGSFSFNDRNHDEEPKTILGVSLRSTGVNEGQEVLDLIALHPNTARHLAFKLCQRFVHDNPPAGLVEEVAAAFLKSEGDIKTTLKTLFRSDTFYAAENRGTKLKSPFEFAVSSLRALDADLEVEKSETRRHLLMTFEGLGAIGNAPKQLTQAKRKSVNWSLAEMGQPLFAYPAPTGYPENASHWQEAGLALQRMNFALALVRDEVAGVHFEKELKSLEALVPIEREVSISGTDKELRMAAILASPEFQYR